MLYGVGIEEGLGLGVLFAIFFCSGYYFVFSLAGDEFGRHFGGFGEQRCISCCVCWIAWRDGEIVNFSWQKIAGLKAVKKWTRF